MKRLLSAVLLTSFACAVLAQSSVLSSKIVAVAAAQPAQAPVAAQSAPKAGEDPAVVTEESEVARLLAASAVNIPVQGGTLASAVDLIANTAGMNYIAPSPEEFPEAVTLNVRVNPWKLLQLLGDRYRFTMQFREGIWVFTREQTGALVTKTYELRYNNLDTYKASQNSFNMIGGTSTIGEGGSSGGESGGGGMVFTPQTQKIIDDLRDIIGLPSASIAKDGKMPVDVKFAVARVKGEAGDDAATTSTPKQGQTSATNGGKVVYISDQNALLITASRQQHEQVQEYLKIVDQKPRTVHIEARFVETSHSPSSVIGMDPSNYQPGASVSPSDSLNGVVDFGHLSASTAPKGVLSFDTMKFQLKALATDTKAKVINSPSVDVISNREAYFSVGDEEPFVTATTTNTSDAGLGSTQARIAIRRIGTSVNLIPTIFRASPGEPEQIRIQVRIEVGVLKEFRQLNSVSVPVVTSQKYEYTVYLKDGETLAFGGLSGMSLSEGVKKVPIAGDIPVLGYIFKSKNKSASQRNLVAYINARIVREGDKAPVPPTDLSQVPTLDANKATAR